MYQKDYDYHSETRDLQICFNLLMLRNLWSC